MNYFGVYHSDYSRSNAAICDAPCIAKGRMLLCARHTASQGGLIAMVAGRVRNRSALLKALDAPRESTDAQLILSAYRAWGEDYPRRVEGAAASCVMDTEADAMVLARDRMGEMPLFWAARGGSVAFSDHPDTLLKTDAASAVVDAGGLRELFALGPARTPGLTPLRDVFSLEPGCALICRDGARRVARYFEIEEAEHRESAEDTVAHTRALLETCVDEVAGARCAVMLSGGLDSTALTALLRRRGGEILSFSVDYQDNARDFRANRFRPEMDAPYVAQAVRAFGTQHRAVTLDAQSLAQALGRAVSLRGFPGMADIDASLYLFAGEIARFAGSVVSGECGDEVFGGYPWFKDASPLEGFPWSGSLPLRESLLLPEARRALRLGEYARAVFEAHRDRADPGAACPEGERRLKILQKLCFEYFMTNLQERAVRMCEGAGVKVLTPLCDDRLVQYVYNVPWEMKFMGGQEKGLFRAAVSDLLPEALLKRVKSPYPKTCSPAYSRAVRAMARRMTRDGDAPIFQVVDRARVDALIDADLDPAGTPWFGQLMAGPQMLGYLWQVNEWMRERRIRLEI